MYLCLVETRPLGRHEPPVVLEEGPGDGAGAQTNAEDLIQGAYLDIHKADGTGKSGAGWVPEALPFRWVNRSLSDTELVAFFERQISDGSECIISLLEWRTFSASTGCCARWSDVRPKVGSSGPR